MKEPSGYTMPVSSLLPKARLLVGLLISAVVLVQLFDHRSSVPTGVLNRHPKPDPFEIFPLGGFANTRIPHEADCDDLRVEGEVAVSDSIYLDDDLLDIANSIEHEIIDYSEQPKGQSFASMVKKTWSRMSGSSVWLKKHEVYFTVSRVFFYTKGVKHWPVMSFLRVQLHDENWIELKNHTLEWKGQSFTFPRILDIDAPYNIGGSFYGPEDPRIIIEQDVEDAEPLIIFNMVSNLTSVARSMHAHHPFSNFTTEFIIDHQKPTGAEKNWMPFFMPQTQLQKRGQPKYPSMYVNFLYNFNPLRILRCHVLNGGCSWAYIQPIPASYSTKHMHNETSGAMRGGSNFEPLPPSLNIRPGLTSFIGIPRTHIDAGCLKEAQYRPEFMVLTTDGETYWLDYVSQEASFGTKILPPDLADDPCDKGRIMMANSIARMHNYKPGKPKQDLMEVTFSVADSTIQIATLKGLVDVVANLPQFDPVSGVSWQSSDVEWNANVTSDVLKCSVASAAQYAIANAPILTDKMAAHIS